MPVISFSGISRHYEMGEQLIKAVDSLDLTIDRNEYVVLIGSSGSGKSTLMNIIGCLDTPTSGTYVLNEHNVAGLSESDLADIRNREIGFIFQSFNLLPRISAERNVMQPLVYRGVGVTERRRLARAMLEKVGLGDRADHLPTETIRRTATKNRRCPRTGNESVAAARRTSLPGISIRAQRKKYSSCLMNCIRTARQSSSLRTSLILPSTLNV